MVIYFTPILILTYFTTKHYYKQYQLKNHPYNNLRNIQTSEQLENFVDNILEYIKFSVQNKPTQISRDSNVLLNILGREFSPEVSKTVYNALENNDILLHDESFSPTFLHAVNLAIEKPLQLNVYDYLFKVSIIGVGTYDLFHLITPQPYYDKALERIETIKLSTKASLIELKDNLTSYVSFAYADYSNSSSPKISNTWMNSTNYVNTIPSLYTIIENMFFPTKNQTIHEAICDCVLISITLSAIIGIPIIMPYPLTNWVLYKFPEGSKPNSSSVSIIMNYTTLEQNLYTCGINENEDFPYLNYQQCQDSEKHEMALQEKVESFGYSLHINDTNYVIYLGTIEDIILRDITTSAA